MSMLVQPVRMHEDTISGSNAPHVSKNASGWWWFP